MEKIPKQVRDDEHASLDCFGTKAPRNDGWVVREDVNRNKNERGDGVVNPLVKGYSKS